jgi:hypothetical protein
MQAQGPQGLGWDTFLTPFKVAGNITSAITKPKGAAGAIMMVGGITWAALPIAAALQGAVRPKAIVIGLGGGAATAIVGAVLFRSAIDDLAPKGLLAVGKPIVDVAK